jgi:prophage antirepressor-like protein
MSEQLVPFLFEGESLVRIVIRGGEPWFVAADVCKAIGIKQAARAVEPLDEDEKGVSSIHTLGGLQEVLIVSDGGLYTLVLRSRDATKPGTVPHRFRRWVTSDVLPAIRQTGGYTTKATIEPPPYPEKRDFPEWPLEEMRTKGQMVTLYRLNYGPPAAQWVMPQLGFPVPPKHLITEGRQMELFTESITITRSPRPPDDE